MPIAYLDEERSRIDAKPVSKLTSYFINYQASFLDDEKLTTIRDFVLESGPQMSIPGKKKANIKSSEYRKVGNTFFRTDLRKAIECYNKSLCHAEVGSENVGIAYGNRSAVYFEQGHYAICLENIKLAKQHRYPQRLMHKLDSREEKCLEKIKKFDHISEKPTLVLSYEPNPNIPFVIGGLDMNRNDRLGRGIVTNVDLKVGDVILVEKPLMNTPGAKYKYLRCDYCASENYQNLFSCQTCTNAMFCSDECLQKSMKTCHKYECGMLESLQFLSEGSSKIYIGVRMLWLLLSTFDDNVGEVMKFTSKKTEGADNPFKLDYNKMKPSDEFAVFNSSKRLPGTFKYKLSFSYYAALYYSVIIKHPPISKLFVTAAQQEYLLQTIYDYMELLGFLIIGSPEAFSTQYFTFASLLNHSCAPNTSHLYKNNTLKLVVNRPIKKGEQIFVTYGVICAEQEKSIRIDMNRRNFHFHCQCEACLKYYPLREKIPFCDVLAAKAAPILTTLNQMSRKETLEKLRDFIQNNSSVYPKKELYLAIYLYDKELIGLMADEMDPYTY